MTRRPRPALDAGTHTVSWTEAALDQLADIGVFLSDDSKYARNVASEIRRAAASLDLFPGRGVVLEGEVRFLVILDRYILRYEHDDAQVDILGVRDGRRDS